MKTRISKGKWVLIALALLTAMFIAACGGGGSAGGGIGGTGKAVGAIDGFGSIFVNGVEFETSTASISIDDSAVAGTEGDLKLGMIVEVEGEFNDDGTTGTAFTVASDDVVEGPVTSAVDTTARSFRVMGQEVLYTATTVFKESGGGALAPTDLNIDNVVEVSGLLDSGGKVKATRVERKAISYNGNEPLEVNGIVSGLTTTSASDGSFFIHFLEVRYSAATSIDSGTLTDERLVEVKGSNDVNADGYLDADSIEFEDEDLGVDGDLLQFEGVVTSIASSSGYDFEVNGLPVVTDDPVIGTTQWRGGYASLSDVTLDDRVEVEGTLQDQGGTQVLLAREVELEIEDDVRIEGPVQAVDASSNILSILDIGVAYSDTTSITEFEDKASVATSVDQLSTADWVRIEAVIDSSGNVFATRIEQDNDDAGLNETILRGPAADVPVSPGDFTILGVDIAVTGIAGIQYRIEETGTSQAVFFDNLANGRIVKAKGEFNAGTLTPVELELQN